MTKLLRNKKLFLWT